jgi:hypothetical protein
MLMIQLAAAAVATMAAAVWLSPDALRWCICRMAARMAYIEAGRQAYRQELERLEVSA